MMATYAELYSLKNNDDLLHKVAVAVIVAADTIRAEDAGTTNHANRLVWASEAFGSPVGKSRQVLWALLAANKDVALAGITGATDAAIQANVDAVVDVLAGVA
jgi:hypothetical protein